MTIRRFQEFLSKNEDTILDECGFPTASQILDVLPFYKVNDKLAFVFVEEEDVVWKVSLDAFSFTVYDNSIINKSLLVSVIEGMDFAIFIRKNKSYTFYGVFKLANPYIDVSGVGKVIDPHTPLDFYLEKGDYIL